MSSYYYGIDGGATESRLTNEQFNRFLDMLEEESIKPEYVDGNSIYFGEVSGMHTEIIAHALTEILMENGSNMVFVGSYSGDDTGFELIDREGTHGIDLRILANRMQVARQEELSGAAPAEEQTVAPN